MRAIRQWTSETVGGLPRQFWYLWTNTLINRLGSFVVIYLAFYLTQIRHFDITFVGLVLGLSGAGAAIGTLIGGVLADRVGRRPTFLVALYASAGLMLLLGFAHDRIAVAILVFTYGLVRDASRPALSALMIDIVPEPDRLRAYTLNYWAINLGFAFAATMAGLLASLDYRLLFILDAATTVIATTVAAVKVREPVRPLTSTRPHPTAARARAAAPGLRAVFADRVFIGFTLCSLCLALVFSQHLSTLPIAMTQDGLSAHAYGLVIALNGVLIVVGQLFVPRLLRRHRAEVALAAGAVMTGVGFGLTAFANGVWLYAVTVLIWTVGEMLNSPSGSTTLAGLSPAEMRGRYQGVYSLSWSVANFAAPILGAFVLQHAGNTALWLGCLALALLVALAHLAAGPARARQAALLRDRDVTPSAGPAPAASEVSPRDRSGAGTRADSPTTRRVTPATPTRAGSPN